LPSASPCIFQRRREKGRIRTEEERELTNREKKKILFQEGDTEQYYVEKYIGSVDLLLYHCSPNCFSRTDESNQAVEELLVEHQIGVLGYLNIWSNG
jgi:hypothetical protein